MAPSAGGSRRALLRGLAVGVGTSLAGCLGGTLADESSERWTEIPIGDRTRFRGWIPTYRVTADRITEGEDGTVAGLETHSAEVRREILQAIATPGFFTWEPPRVLDEDVHRATIELGEERFDISVGVTDYIDGLAEGWESPVKVRAHRAEDTVRIRIQNITAETIDLLGVGSPPFGVLVAMHPSEQTFLLHDDYSANERIVTGAAFPFTREGAFLQPIEVTIESGETLETVYSSARDLPADLSMLVQFPVRVHEPTLVEFIGDERAFVDLRIGQTGTSLGIDR